MIASSPRIPQHPSAATLKVIVLRELLAEQGERTAAAKGLLQKTFEKVI